MSREGDFSVETRMNEVIAQFEENRLYYTEEEPSNETLAHLAEAMLQKFKQPGFREQFKDILDLRPDLTKSHAVKLTERIIQFDLLKHDPHYPHGYRNAEKFLEQMEAIEADTTRSEALTNYFYTRDVQSNVAERYKAVKMVTMAYKERFGDNPSVLDVGCSTMLGGKKLAYNDLMPFGDVSLASVKDEVEYQRLIAGEIMPRRDRHLTALANRALSRCVDYGAMAGVDIADVDDPMIRRWIKSCSFYPDELLIPKLVEEYDLLDILDPHHDRIPFIQGDFSNPKDIKKIREIAPDDGYQMIVFSTIFYQLEKESERVAMLTHAASLLADGGVIIVQDAKDGNFSKKYNYTTSVMDSANGELGEQEVLRWKTARCSEAVVGMGKVAINGEKPRTFHSVIEEMVA